MDDRMSLDPATVPDFGTTFDHGVRAD